jgi:hypothetical protein
MVQNEFSNVFQQNKQLPVKASLQRPTHNHHCKILQDQARLAAAYSLKYV